MDVFIALLTNLFPLYLLIGLGFIAGKHFGVDRNSLANLAIFIVMPIVTFGFILQLEIKPSYFLLPFVTYFLQAAVAFPMLWLGKIIYGDNRANLLSMCSAVGNNGYLGLPLVILLFPPSWVSVYMLMLLGNVLFECTVSYYIGARGNFSVKDSVMKLVKFPAIYAIAFALCLNFYDFGTPDLFITYWGYFKGAYVVIGMMIIGAALSGVDKLVFSPKFFVTVIAGKFFLWPCLAFCVILLDKYCLQLFENEVHELLIVFAIVPPAANITAFAAQLNLKPEKAATTVLAGTIVALFYIPAFLVLSGMH